MQAEIGTRHPREILAEDFEAAAGCVIKPGDEIQERGLPGSGSPKQRDELTLLDVERNTIEGADNNPAHLVVLLEITGAKHRDNFQFPTPNSQLPKRNFQLPTVNSQPTRLRDERIGSWELGIGS